MFALVPVSGNGLRPSLFGGTADKARTFHPTLGRNAWMGQVTPADWYLRATQAIGKFDELLSRTGLIADQTEREKILSWVGRASVSDTPAYKYSSLRDDLNVNVNNFTPPNVNAYLVDGRQNLVTDLEAVNTGFESLVAAAETAYGQLAQPVTIERDKIVARQSSIKWVLPIIVGVAAIGVAAVVSLLGKR